MYNVFTLVIVVMSMFIGSCVDTPYEVSGIVEVLCKGVPYVSVESLFNILSGWL